ncbi:MAG: PAS domain S-box protein [Planctomycetes bacterium]|nr:PAS domain S-box protein [Planctomycetota bacterium]
MSSDRKPQTETLPAVTCAGKSDGKPPIGATGISSAAGLDKSDTIPVRESSISDLNSELLWSVLFHALPEAIVLFDRAGLVRKWSTGAEQLYGYSEAEVMGKPWSQFVPDDRQASMRRLLRRACLGENINSIDSTHHRKDGQPLDVRLSWAPVRDSRGEVTGILMMARDATAVNKVLTEAAYLRVLVDVLPVVVFYLNVQGHVRFINRASISLLGIDSETAMGRHIRDVMGEALYKQSQECIERAIRGAAVDYELILENSQSETRCLQMTVRPDHDGLGRILGVVGVASDISAAKRYEAELEKTNQELSRAKALSEAATQAKSEFLANMSHEIRTPMTAILGFADVLMTPDVSPAEVHEAAGTIRRNGVHLLEIINDILDISKIESGRIAIESIPCSPELLVREVVELMRIRADEKKLSLDVEYRGDIPSRISTDPTRLRQILINLVSNAIKFTQMGGVSLIVSTENCPTRGPLIVFEVEDSGMGISPASLSRLFQPFEQGDTSTTRRFGGTGLGLVISRRLARFMGGDIQVDSTPGIGSTFRAFVSAGPIDGPQRLSPDQTDPVVTHPSRAIAPSATGDALQGCRILFAEDGLDNQLLISRLLEKSGANVRLVDNGRKALDAALAAWQKQEPFDVLLLDMLMPEMDGYEATRRLREAGYRGPIIALTASAMHQDRERCMESGCDWFAAKPIRRDELISIIARFFKAAK